jgi:hypothetical protein
VKEGDNHTGAARSLSIKDWKEARRFVRPLPFTFTYNRDRKEVLIIEGVREDWAPKPVKVIESIVGFLDTLRLDGVVLANTFVINNIRCYREKGRRDKWKQ